MPPTAIWTLEGSGSRFKVKNEHTALYVPQLVSSTPTTASKTGGLFTFALNGDGTTWNIKGANGQYWDGLESGASWVGVAERDTPFASPPSSPSRCTR